MSVLLLAAVLAAGSSGLDECDARVLREPQSFEAYRCYWTTARRDNRFAEAIARLEARLRSSPQDHRAELYLGLLLSDRQDDRAEPLLSSAAEEFARDGNDRGEVYARISLVSLLRSRGRPDEASAQLDAGEHAAERSEDPELTTLVAIERGWEAYHAGDYGQAYAIFRRLSYRTSEGRVPEYLYTKTLSGLGASAWAVSRFEDALSAYLRQADILRRRQQPFEESTARANVALLSRYCGLGREEILRYAAEARSASETAGNRYASSQMELVLGGTADSQTEKLAHYRTALALARSSKEIKGEVLAADALGMAIAEEPGRLDEALRWIAWADHTARGIGDTEREIATGTARWSALWSAGERERAFAAADELLDRIERVVDRERGHPNRARVFSRHSAVYRGVVGRLLDERSGLGADGIGRAFDVLERMRSRELLFAIETAPSPQAKIEEDSGGALRPVLARIAETQRRLVDRSLSEEERERFLAELDTLEAEEAALAERVAHEAPRRVDVAALRERLDEDEMLVSYSLMPKDVSDTGSWLLAVGRSGARSYRLPEMSEITSRVRMFLSLVERGDGSEAAAASRLYEDLLLPALRDSPTPVKRLVVLPDDVLHELPFELLRPSVRGAEAAGLSITIAPSATIWLHLKDGPHVASASALALADPLLPDRSGRAGLSRDWRALGAEELGALPFARDEALDVSEAFQDVVVRNGVAASETFLKTADLSRYVLLHVAAHTLVDSGRPERSALLFCPGSRGEDGLLQPREISSLDLRGRVVVLSSCRSASGEILGGEGPLGLAQAMFQAGARAVVGSLWPLEDEDAERFVREFYVALGRGESIAAALAEARRARQDAGAPAISWAGFVVIGDGDFVPVPGGRPGPAYGIPSAMAGIGLLTLLTFAWWRRSAREVPS